MYRAAQKLYTSATAPSKKATQEGWRVENLGTAAPPEDDGVVVLQAAHDAYASVDVAAPARGGNTDGALSRQAVEFDVEAAAEAAPPAELPPRPRARSPSGVESAARAAAARVKAAAAVDAAARAAPPADGGGAEIDSDTDDDADPDAEPEPVPPRVWDKYRRYRESASRVIAQLRIE